MYIIYETAHTYYDEERNEKYKRNYPKKTVPNDLLKPEFMPKKLVRICDMNVVYSSQVNEGYCALSYSWNQSGDVIHDKVTGKSKRIDEGKHMIIDSLEQTTSFDGKDEVLYVKFEGIIQQICQQFNIKYIWYDQMCINQDDKEEKQHEIRSMHHIYGNAYCTVALVPELQDDNIYIAREDKLNIQNWQYFNRLWTLEEAIKSERLLYVGKNIHRWGEELLNNRVYYAEINTFSKSLSQLSVQEILYHAHQRASTKDHDRVFALIQLFPDIIDMINIDYEQPLESLMIQFYNLLAKKDIGILAFRKRRFTYDSPMQYYKFLPTWTGIHGEHLQLMNTATPFQNYKIIWKTMHVTCTFVTNEESTDDNNPFALRYEDLLYCLDIMKKDDEKWDYKLGVVVQLDETGVKKKIHIYDASYRQFFQKKIPLGTISQRLQLLSRFIKIRKQDLCFYHKDEDCAYIDLKNYLTEDVDQRFAHYVILSGINFERYDIPNINRYPVIMKKHGEKYYKAIGTCVVRNANYLFSACNLNEKTFLIQ